MSNTKSATHTTVTIVPAIPTLPAVPSIRNLILTGIRNNEPKAETFAKVSKFHPNSAATQKFAKHYAWYKGWLKKNPDKTEE